MTTQEAKRLSQDPQPEAVSQRLIGNGPQMAKEAVPPFLFFQRGQQEHSEAKEEQKSYSPPQPAVPAAEPPIAANTAPSPPQGKVSCSFVPQLGQIPQKPCFVAPKFGPPVQNQAEAQFAGQQVPPKFVFHLSQPPAQDPTNPQPLKFGLQVPKKTSIQPPLICSIRPPKLSFSEAVNAPKFGPPAIVPPASKPAQPPSFAPKFGPPDIIPPQPKPTHPPHFAPKFGSPVFTQPPSKPAQPFQLPSKYGPAADNPPAQQVSHPLGPGPGPSLKFGPPAIMLPAPPKYSAPNPTSEYSKFGPPAHPPSASQMFCPPSDPVPDHPDNLISEPPKRSPFIIRPPPPKLDPVPEPPQFGYPSNPEPGSPNFGPVPEPPQLCYPSKPGPPKFGPAPPQFGYPSNPGPPKFGLVPEPPQLGYPSNPAPPKSGRVPLQFGYPNNPEPGPPKFGPQSGPPNFGYPSNPVPGPPKIGFPSNPVPGPPQSSAGYCPPHPPKFGPPAFICSDSSSFNPPDYYPPPGPPKFGPPGVNPIADLGVPPNFSLPPKFGPLLTSPINGDPSDPSALLPSHRRQDTDPVNEYGSIGRRPDYPEDEYSYPPFLARRHDPDAPRFCEICNADIPDEGDRHLEYFEHIAMHEEERYRLEMREYEYGYNDDYSGDESDYDRRSGFERYMGRRRYIDEIDVNDYEVSDSQVLMSLDQHMYDPGNGLIPEKLQHIVEVDYKGTAEVVNCLCGDDLASGQRVKYLSCAHVFHSQCIDNWLSRNAVCPIDRRPIG